jgi:hypothetical protein
MKSKIGTIAVMVVISLAANACIPFRKSVVIQDSGPAVTREFEVGSITRIQLKGGGIVKLVQGEANALVVEAPQSIMDQLQAKVEDDKLIIGYKDSTIAFTTNRDVIFTITFKDLEEFVLDGGAEIKADKLDLDTLVVDLNGGAKLDFPDFKANYLKLSLDGGGAVSISGQVGQEEVKLAGAGAYLTPGLQSNVAMVQLDGAGVVEVWVKESLDARLNGLGQISYWGNPQVKQTIAGLGQIEHKGDK